MSAPSADDTVESDTPRVGATLPSRRSMRTGAPDVSTAARYPSSGPNAMTWSSAGTRDEERQSVESSRGYEYADSTPPARETRRTIGSCPPGMVGGAPAPAGRDELSAQPHARSTSARARGVRTA